MAVITFARLNAGLQGGGGTAAINGGAIAAGFDAACVLAGLGHYNASVVVTLELPVKFLSLAIASDSLAFRAHVVRSARNFSFVEGQLLDVRGPRQSSIRHRYRTGCAGTLVSSGGAGRSGYGRSAAFAVARYRAQQDRSSPHFSRYTHTFGLGRVTGFGGADIRCVRRDMRLAPTHRAAARFGH